MKLYVDKELLEIIHSIMSHNYSEQRWSEIESSDMFQTERYCGGYDADEQAFCFSYFSLELKEYWFQFTLEEASQIFSGKIKELTMMLANN